MKKIYLIVVFCLIRYAAYAVYGVAATTLTPAATVCAPSPPDATTYAFQILNTTAGATLNTVNFTLAGTVGATEITSFKLYRNTVAGLVGATLMKTIPGGAAGPYSFTTLGFAQPTGAIYYYTITATLSATAVVGHNFNITQISSIAVTGTTTAGTPTAAAGLQTISMVPSGVSATANPNPICSGDNLTLTGAATNATSYSWSGPAAFTSTAQNPASFIATIANAGTYTIAATNTCGTTNATTVLTVDALPTSMTALATPNPICNGGFLSLTGTVTGGSGLNFSWYGPGYTNATQNPPAFAVTPASQGVYTFVASTAACAGTDSAFTLSVTVNDVPTAVTATAAPTSLCVGNMLALTGIATGATSYSWSGPGPYTSVSQNPPSFAVTAANSGTYTFSATNACGTTTAITTSITVNTAPTGVTATALPTTLCAGSLLSLFGTATGATTTTWTGPVGSGYTSAMLNPPSFSATALDSGIYSLVATNACGAAVATVNVAVNSSGNAGVIVGPTMICQGSFAFLFDTTASLPGVWGATNGTVTVSSGGVITGIAVGIDTITYSITGACGTVSASKYVTVNPLPVVNPITGVANICVGTAVPFGETTTGGIWTSSNGTATVSGAGIVTGVSVGGDTISYSVTNGCGTVSQTFNIAVTNSPSAGSITAPSTLCAGALVTLIDLVSGGVWSCSNGNATVIPATGLLTGVLAGIDTITYTVSNLCGTASTTVSISIQSLTSAGTISGPNTVCASATISLTESATGGVWSTSNPNATITATGLVTGVTGGNDSVVYSITNSCGTVGTFYLITINPAPNAGVISGITNECAGTISTLSETSTGGIWTSTNSSIASIDSITGIVTGVSQGVVTISYNVTDVLGCIGVTTVSDTVNIPPVSTPILGSNNVCVGSNLNLSDSSLWGVWSSSNAAVASVGSATGIVTGVNAGSALVFYVVINNCGSASDSTYISVHALPFVAPIAGPSSTICAGSSAILSDATTGGIWISSDTSVATVGSSSGVVTGVTAGNVTIMYSVTDTFGCVGDTAINVAFGNAIGTVNVLPAGTATICNGHNVYMHIATSVTGLTYQWLRNGIAIVGATGNSYTTTLNGNYSVLVSNGTCDETISGTTVVNMVQPTISLTPPNILYTGSYASYQWFKNGTAIAGATSSIYSETGAGYYMVVVTDINGCSDTSGIYTVGTGGSGSGVGFVPMGQFIHIYPNPATSLIMVDAPFDVFVQVLSPDGKVVIEKSTGGEIAIDRLVEGLYFISVFDKEGVLIKIDRFLKL